MVTPRDRNVSALLALCDGNLRVTDGFTASNPELCLFAVIPSKPFNKQSSYWLFKTPWRSVTPKNVYNAKYYEW